MMGERKKEIVYTHALLPTKLSKKSFTYPEIPVIALTLHRRGRVHTYTVVATTAKINISFAKEHRAELSDTEKETMQS